MALNRRKSVMMVAAAVLLAAGLVWAWVDGGERPLAPLTAPAMLPGDAQ
ncbi:MAG: hypothetical protein ACK4YM_05115 [Novosphingobium sp.]